MRAANESYRRKVKNATAFYPPDPFDGKGLTKLLKQYEKISSADLDRRIRAKIVELRARVEGNQDPQGADAKRILIGQLDDIRK